jgi:nucleotidyltransferase substrate binding protein (TIGR01987 family)
MTKLHELLSNLKNANGRLKESLALEPTRIHKDATIQRFEFTVELAWKTMQEAARFMGEDAVSPRDAIRVAARIELIADPEAWLSMLQARNLTAHVYRENVADEVYKEAKKLPSLVDDLTSSVSTRTTTG